MYRCGRGRGRGCGSCFLYYLIVVSILFAFVFGVFIFGCGSVRGDCVWVGWRVAREDVQREGEGDSEHLFFSRCAWDKYTFLTDNDMDYRRFHSICDKLACALTRVLGHHGVPVALLGCRVVPVGHGIDGVARHRIPTRPRRR